MNSLIVLVIILIGFISVNGQPANKQNLLQIGNFEQCEGKDASNYTSISQYTMDSLCKAGSVEGRGESFLIACQPNGQKTVNALKVLAESEYPAGAYYQAEILYLAQSGNLEGKYVYIKEIGLTEAYLKKCSSVMGYGYVSTKSQALLIAEKLDVNIFLNPGGAYEPFKKTASTVCQGRAITV